MPSDSAARGTTVSWSAPGPVCFPETFYQQYNPYVWHTAQDCTRIANASAEVIGKAAGGQGGAVRRRPPLQNSVRKFGTYIPNLPVYGQCNSQNTTLAPGFQSERPYAGAFARPRMEEVIDEGLEVLTEEECLVLMATVPIGRIAVIIGALPAIFPVNFVLRDGVIYFRTGVGTKLSAATDHSVVAFEVDAIDPLEHAGWSVLAIGPATPVTSAAELASLARLPLVPWVEGERTHLVRIPLELVSGRRIVHGGGLVDFSETER